MGCDPIRYVVDGNYGSKGIATPGPTFNDLIRYALRLAPDGSVVMAPSANGKSSIVRITANGTVDAAFAAKVPPTTNFVTSIDFDRLGRIVVGEVAYQKFVIRRLLPDGHPDLSWGTNGSVDLSYPLASAFVDVAVDHADRVDLLFSEPTTTIPYEQCAVARLDPNGKVDPSFNGGHPLTLASPPANVGPGCMKIVVRGNDGVFVAESYLGVTAISPSGVLDSSYGNGAQTYAGQTYGGIVDMVALPGDQLALGGDNYNPSYGWRLSVSRLLANGQLDPTFGQGGIDDVGFADLQPDCTSGVPNYDRIGWLQLTPSGNIVAVGGTCDELIVARWLGGHLDKTLNADGREMLRSDVFTPRRDLSKSLAGAVGPDGSILTFTSSQGESPLLGLIRLTGPQASH